MAQVKEIQFGLPPQKAINLPEISTAEAKITIAAAIATDGKAYGYSGDDLVDVLLNKRNWGDLKNILLALLAENEFSSSVRDARDSLDELCFDIANGQITKVEVQYEDFA